MGNIVEFAGVASAIIGAMGLAMCLEWLALNGLMNLMPRHDRATRRGGGSRDEGCDCG